MAQCAERPSLVRGCTDSSLSIRTGNTGSSSASDTGRGGRWDMDWFSASSRPYHHQLHPEHPKPSHHLANKTSITTNTDLAHRAQPGTNANINSALSCSIATRRRSSKRVHSIRINVCDQAPAQAPAPRSPAVLVQAAAAKTENKFGWNRINTIPSMPSAVSAGSHDASDHEGEPQVQAIPRRHNSQKKSGKHSDLLRAATNSTMMNPPPLTSSINHVLALPKPANTNLAPPPTTNGTAMSHALAGKTMPINGVQNGYGQCLSDTPLPSAPTTAPGSPRIFPVRQNSGSATPRIRPPATTLNIPGMTRSRISPDGKIAHTDVGAKLVVIMVGLPARGKSYITKKLQRYLSWQQHETRIFNVGNRRRTAAGTSHGPIDSPPDSRPGSPQKSMSSSSIAEAMDAPTQAAHILLNGFDRNHEQHPELTRLPSAETMDQSAKFFDPKNQRASQLREQVALSTLDEVLDFLLVQGGSVGILDATNSTIERRQILFNRIKAREPKLGILFIESVCENEKLLEANMRLKLRGPDYKDKDPETSFLDFKKRVQAYESAYVPLGVYEEEHNMQYIKMIDVGRKAIHYQLQGFLTSGIASYLSTFNLAPRQIWITRHGKSEDNVLGRLGGDSDLTPEGRNYGTVLYNFITKKRAEWEADQTSRAIAATDFLPREGDRTPPYPELVGDDLDAKNFCVWTSMLQRSIQTAEDFQEDENYDVKNWEMLNEIHAGKFEGMTYEGILEQYREEYNKRDKDKLHYIYPGVGGEGYLQVISRLRDMVRELERIKDHVLIVGHRSVCRVLMAYFMDLTRDDIADLDVPLGQLVSIEPKPYGIEFHAYKYNEESFDFDELPDFKPQKETAKGN